MSNGVWDLVHPPHLGLDGRLLMPWEVVMRCPRLEFITQRNTNRNRPLGIPSNYVDVVLAVVPLASPDPLHQLDLVHSNHLF